MCNITAGKEAAIYQEDFFQGLESFWAEVDRTLRTQISQVKGQSQVEDQGYVDPGDL